MQHQFLLFGRHGDDTSAAVVVRVPAKPHDERSHKPVILLGIHAALHLGEPTGIADGIAAPEVRATAVGCAMVWIQKLHVVLLRAQLLEGDAVEALPSLWALGVHTDWVVVGSRGIEFLDHRQRGVSPLV